MALIYQFIQTLSRSPRNAVPSLSYTQLALDSFDTIYPPDGVDPLEETLNGSKEEFNSEEGKEFRTHFLTRLTSFFGLPNRKLRKNAGQSIQNLDDNFTGKQAHASTTRNLIRAAVIPLNIIMILIKLALNTLKLITEFIPGFLLKFSFITMMHFVHLSEKQSTATKRVLIFLLGELLCSPIILISLYYFSGCCLTSSYDTMKSAWRIGSDMSTALKHKSKLLAYLFVAICIISTLFNFIWATPLVLKMFAITVVPLITHYLPPVLMNFIDKIITTISPTLSAIGHVLATFSSCAPICFFGYYSIPFTHMFSSMPALVGAGLFSATAIATIGPSISGYINDFKAWWNFNPDFVKPLENEGNNSEELSQQCRMLCALREPEESLPVVVVNELPIIPEDHISEYKPLLTAAVNNSAVSSANLAPPQDKQAELHPPNNNKSFAPSENHPTDTDRIINHNISPRRRS